MIKIQYPLLIDGGLSNELERQGHDLNHRLWSAHLLNANPEAIIQAHLSYLNAGAQCITTASYQASIPGLLAEGFDQKVANELILKSVILAETAVLKFNEQKNSNYSKTLIAASIGPYGAYLADGSEYRGNYGISDDELKAFHQPRIELLNQSNADFFACETIPSFQEVKVLVELLIDAKKPAWISFSCKDDFHINDGTPISECAEFISSYENIFAIGVNCTAPKYISSLIQEIKSQARGKKIVIYPNTGEVYHANSKTWLGTSDPQSYLTMMKEWKNLGADILGGCCRIGPNHIKDVSRFLRKEE